MSNRKPDLFWILAIIVALGAASSHLVGDDGPKMSPEQAGIIVQ